MLRPPRTSSSSSRNYSFDMQIETLRGGFWWSNRVKNYSPWNVALLIVFDGLVRFLCNSLWPFWSFALLCGCHDFNEINLPRKANNVEALLRWCCSGNKRLSAEALNHMNYRKPPRTQQICEHLPWTIELS